MSTAIVTDAAEINREHQLARQAASNAVSHAIRCGELLAARKGELPHGEFMNWVGGHCDFAYSTASRYMKAAAESSTGVEISTLSELFLSGRGAATPAPEPASVSTEQEHDGIPHRWRNIKTHGFLAALAAS